MAWTPRTLADALNNIAELNIDIENNESWRFYLPRNK
ncbi:hypothetical protein LTSEMIN_6245 [Salmonella enterica subsp. enterica serovar Minnesota str. A4-603]|nr:hypothetical protein LTSEMIN_6245 [Salmonella enterica subsp. enterica serovar Minnesota str. A4-603]